MLAAQEYFRRLTASVPARRGPIRLVLLAALFAFAFSAAARAGDIVVVTSSDAAPYVQAQAGIKKQFAEQNRQVRTVALQDVSKNGLDATVGADADLVLAVGTPAAVWLHARLPAARPFVYCMVVDPRAAGLADGRASYGVSTDVPLKSQLALIAEALPKARTLGMLYRSNTAEGQRLLKSLQESLPNDWQLKPVAIDSHASIADAIEALMKQRVDVVWTAPDPTIYDTASVRALLLASLRTNIPVFGYSAAFVKAGALIGIGVDPLSQGVQAAALALRLLKGPAGSEPSRINPPDAFLIAANLIVASNLGIQLPPDLVQRAAYVYKEGR